MKVDFKDWERVLWRDEKAHLKFINEFLVGDGVNNIMILSSVYWNSCSMKVYYILNSGQHITDTFSIQLWEDFYNENK